MTKKVKWKGTGGVIPMLNNFVSLYPDKLSNYANYPWLPLFEQRRKPHIRKAHSISKGQEKETF